MTAAYYINKMRFGLGIFVSSLLSLGAHAQIYYEGGDAGATLATAPTLPGFGRFDAIHGKLSSQTDADLFRVWVNDPYGFSATTVGGTTLDTTLFLLKGNGAPAYLNDDDARGLTLQSTLRAANFPTPLSIGYYYLGVTTSGLEPTNISGQLLFSPFILSPSETRRAASGLSPDTLYDFTSRWGSPELGSYTVKLSGFGAVPEPGTYGMMGAVGLALIVATRRRLGQR